MADSKENYKFDLGVKGLTNYSLTSTCIFSILLARQILQYPQGEFVWQSGASLVGIPIPYMFDSAVVLYGLKG